MSSTTKNTGPFRSSRVRCTRAPWLRLPQVVADASPQKAPRRASGKSWDMFQRPGRILGVDGRLVASR